MVKLVALVILKLVAKWPKSIARSHRESWWTSERVRGRKKTSEREARTHLASVSERINRLLARSLAGRCARSGGESPLLPASLDGLAHHRQ